MFSSLSASLLLALPLASALAPMTTTQKTTTPITTTRTTTTRTTTASLATNVQSLWGVCGGNGAPTIPWPRTQCESGAWCSKGNEYLWQCLPMSMSPTAISTTPQTTPAPTTTWPLQTKFGRCGGISFSGPSSCEPPATCSVLNAYYWQCL